MIYNVNVALICNTVALQTNIFNKITTFLAGKSVWQNKIELTKATYRSFEPNHPDDGKPTVNLDVRFNQLANKDAVFQAIKAEVNARAGVSCRLTKHNCSHDESPTKPCVIEEMFIK